MFLGLIASPIHHIKYSVLFFFCFFFFFYVVLVYVIVNKWERVLFWWYCSLKMIQNSASFKWITIASSIHVFLRIWIAPFLCFDDLLLCNNESEFEFVVFFLLASHNVNSWMRSHWREKKKRLKSTMNIIEVKRKNKCDLTNAWQTFLTHTIIHFFYIISSENTEKNFSL